MLNLIFEAARDDWAVKAGAQRVLTAEGRVAAVELEREIAAERLHAAIAKAATLAEDAARGRKVMGGAREGGEKRRKLTDQQRAKAKAERDELMREKRHTKNKANGQIAKQYGMSKKTIDRL